MDKLDGYVNIKMNEINTLSIYYENYVQQQLKYFRLKVCPCVYIYVYITFNLIYIYIYIDVHNSKVHNAE